MEKLMTIKQYLEEHPNLTDYTLRLWLRNGLKHIGSRPIRFKASWVDEYIENNAEESNHSKRKNKIQIKKLPTKRNDMKITLEDLEVM